LPLPPKETPSVAQRGWKWRGLPPFSSLLAPLKNFTTERKKKMAQKKNDPKKAKAKPAIRTARLSEGKAPFPAKVRPQSDTDISDVELPAGTGVKRKIDFGM
jgi:hypothetical protein